MDKLVGILYFSPTQTTETVCRSVAAGMGSEEPVIVNFIDPELREKYASGVSSILSPETVPVQLDMNSRSKKYIYPLKAVYKASNCTSCGKCAETCPTGIIEPVTGKYKSNSFKKKCVGCMKCVNICNDEGRIMQPGFLMYWFLKTYLKSAVTHRKEPVTFS